MKNINIEIVIWESKLMRNKNIMYMEINKMIDGLNKKYIWRKIGNILFNSIY